MIVIKNGSAIFNPFNMWSYLATPKIIAMEYNRIVAVTGMPGLYEVISSKSDGAIVRSLEDGATKFVASRVHNLSHLESIEVYTVRDNVNLVDIFNAMKNSSEALPDAKEAKAVKAYFEKVYPDLDFERVYTSDMKKMIKWLDVLQKSGVEIKLSERTEEEGEESENAENEKAAETVTATEAAPAEAPAKAPRKRAPKKKAEE
jgi:prophage DNA circulation protein